MLMFIRVLTLHGSWYCPFVLEIMFLGTARKEMDNTLPISARVGKDLTINMINLENNISVSLVVYILPYVSLH